MTFYVAVLQIHLLVHSGKKDFACPLCSYVTYVTHNLKKHCLTKHKVFFILLCVKAAIFVGTFTAWCICWVFVHCSYYACPVHKFGKDTKSHPTFTLPVAYYHRCFDNQFFFKIYVQNRCCFETIVIFDKHWQLKCSVNFVFVISYDLCYGAHFFPVLLQVG